MGALNRKPVLRLNNPQLELLAITVKNALDLHRSWRLPYGQHVGSEQADRLDRAIRELEALHTKIVRVRASATSDKN